MSAHDGKAFNEVRALLGRLDRSIDEARSKRLGPSVGEREAAPPDEEPARPSVDMDREIGAGRADAPKTDLQRKGASFGRAKPLNRDDNPAPWRSAGDDAMIG